MGLTELPESIIIEIFRLLSIKDVIRIQRTCKHFNSLFKQYPMVLFNVLRFLYSSPFFPTGVCPTYMSVKRLYSKINFSKTMMLEMFAYYTNGGYTKLDPYESMINVFSSKLFDKCYSTVRENNILIKAIFCGGKFMYNVNRSEWEKKGIKHLQKTEEMEIKLNDLREGLERVLRNTCKDIVITGFCIEEPSFMNKSSFRTCVMFSSLRHENDLQVVDSFNFVKERKDVETVGKYLGIDCRVEEQKDFSVVYFGKCERTVRPLAWIQFKERLSSTDVMKIEVEQYIGSYLYILFVDSFDPYVKGLSIGTFITQGKILTLYE